jgi:hypothetical protein
MRQANTRADESERDQPDFRNPFHPELLLD